MKDISFLKIKIANFEKKIFQKWIQHLQPDLLKQLYI